MFIVPVHCPNTHSKAFCNMYFKGWKKREKGQQGKQRNTHNFYFYLQRLAYLCPAIPF